MLCAQLGAQVWFSILAQAFHPLLLRVMVYLSLLPVTVAWCRGPGAGAEVTAGGVFSDSSEWSKPI